LLESLDISHNLFSNIQYSVLSGQVFPNLSSLNISHNSKSLYDLLLTIDGVQLAPALIELDCSYNILTYFSSLPGGLKYLNLDYNKLIFDRNAVNEVMQLRALKVLRISGNTICPNFL
jgi:hypothetical protein